MKHFETPPGRARLSPAVDTWLDRHREVLSEGDFIHWTVAGVGLLVSQLREWSREQAFSIFYETALGKYVLPWNREHAIVLPGAIVENKRLGHRFAPHATHSVGG